MCNKAVIVLVNQRNQALDNGASAEARFLLLQEENEKLKAELAKLKPGEGK